MRRVLAAGLAVACFAAHPAHAQGEDSDAVVIVVDGATLPDLLAEKELRALATIGGAALMNGRSDVRQSFPDTFLPARAIGSLPFTYLDLGHAPPSEVVDELAALPRPSERPTLVMVVSTSPPTTSAANGDELGTVILAQGDLPTSRDVAGVPRALTSDSTRRAGVVATVDPAATVAKWLGLPFEEGAPIETTGESAPLDLYDRYLEQRRLAVPIAAGAWGLVALAGIVGVTVLARRDRAGDRWLALAGALAASLPWLALALLLAGHLPSLTYPTVIPFVLAFVAGGVAFSRWVAARRGISAAIAATGAMILAILAVEATLGWPAAVTPLAGGGQLDGGRFFGMPNIEIGLVLGCALYAAHRMTATGGAILLASCALVTGLPWTGSNFGSAITLFAAAGLWFGIRAGRRWWEVAGVTVATTAIGMALIGLAHRSLTDRATHVGDFLEQTTGIGSALERFADRIGIGLDLVGDSPVALIPVVGTLVLLAVVLRPPAVIARSFVDREPWRDAILVLVLGSIVAYVANDTGAAALGFGFGTALAGLIDVSVASTREMMAR